MCSDTFAVVEVFCRFVASLCMRSLNDTLTLVKGERC